MGVRVVALCIVLLCVSAKKLDLAPRDLPPPGPADQYSFGFSTSWGYDSNLAGVAGPEGWKNMWPECAGSRQSPIDLSTTSSTYNPSLKPLKFNYPPNTGITEQAVNPANTIEIAIQDSANFTMTTPFDTYVLDQFHMHWNNLDPYHGSEHTVDGQQSAFELHFFHYRSMYSADYFPFVNSDPVGIAVLGVFFDIGPANTELEKFITLVRQGHLRLDNDVLNIPNNFDLNLLLPANKADYWVYNGSITVPRCNEVVQWYVLKQHLTLSMDQYNQLALIKGNEFGNYTFTHNFRAVQPANGRTVMASFAQSTAAPATSSSVNAIALGVGIGVGVGVPLIAALIGLIAYMCCCRKAHAPAPQQKTVKTAASAPSNYSSTAASASSAASKSASSAASSSQGSDE